MQILKVIKAEYISDYRIALTFNEGTAATIDFSNLLKGEIFEPLKDKGIFRKFSLNPFTIEWENGADFAPEFLYEMVKNTSSAKSVA